MGLEPTIFGLEDQRVIQLRYGGLVEIEGIEPHISCKA